jgi:hypothetical protein
MFERLLNWLAPERDRAGEKYEQIRRALIIIFGCRGSSKPQELADQTIDRVAAKLSEIVPGYVGDPALYFYGVADKIFLESLRSPHAQPLPGEIADKQQSSEAIELMYECLEECLGQLPAHWQEIIRPYHDGEGREKIARRKQLAEKLGIQTRLLWLEAHRIRQRLKKCVSKCFENRTAA